MKILKWILIGLGVIFVLGTVASLTTPEGREGFEKGVDAAMSESASPSPTATPIADPTPTPTPTPEPEPTFTFSADDEALIFELAIDMSLDEYGPTLCDDIEMLGLDNAVDAMHAGYGEGYWDDEVVRRLLQERCP